MKAALGLPAIFVVLLAAADLNIRGFPHDSLRSDETHYARMLPRLRDLSPERLAAVNEKLFRLERTLAPSGLPGREWYRHRISAPGKYSGYNAVMLPGIREAAEAGRWDEANRKAMELARILGKLTTQLREAELIVPGTILSRRE